MAVELTGKIILMLPQQSGTSARGTWNKQEFVIETEEQYLALKSMGCDFIQGYYFSRPVPSEKFDRFLIERGDVQVKLTASGRRPDRCDEKRKGDQS